MNIISDNFTDRKAIFTNMTPQASEIILKPVSPTDSNVVKLIDKLNKYQIELYGIGMCNLESPESLQKNKSFMIGAYFNDILIGIGAVKFFEDYAEIKRMYVEENYRNISIAQKILNTLELNAMQKGIHRICLETGNSHLAALKFYKKSGYHEIDSFGCYKPNAVSVYFEKVLTNNNQRNN